MSFSYKRTANYYETDQMGVVHHSNHIRYFEEARIAFMNSIGCNVREMEDNGIIIPNVDAYARYLSPIRFGDEIEVIVRLTKFNGAVMEYSYEILRKDGETAATGHTRHCFVDRDFKPMALKKKHPQYYERTKPQVEKTE